MLRTGLLAMISMGAIVFAQSEGGKNCCDKCGDSAGKEMACCAKAELSKDEIKARLKAANRDLKPPTRRSTRSRTRLALTAARNTDVATR